MRWKPREAHVEVTVICKIFSGFWSKGTFRFSVEKFLELVLFEKVISYKHCEFYGSLETLVVGSLGCLPKHQILIARE